MATVGHELQHVGAAIFSSVDTGSVFPVTNENRDPVDAVWLLEDSVTEVEPLFQFILRQFDGVFGADVMQAETCTVYNDPITTTRPPPHP